MNIIWRQAYKYRLRPNGAQQRRLLQLCGSARYAWNQVLAGRNEEYKEYLEDIESAKCWGEDVSLVPKPRPINRFSFTYDLNKLMAEEENSFLKTQGHSQVLQQKMQDLNSAFSRFFKGKGGYPQFKTKNGYNSIRFPQGINLDEKNQRIFLPKTGFVRYRKSRDIEGDIKNVTVSFFSGEWYVSIQTQREIEVPEINLKTMLETESDNALGIDMGAVRFCTFSDGRYEESLKSNELTRLDERIAIVQRQLKNKKKGSNRRLRLIKRISRLHQKKANIRNDSHQKLSTLICNSHAIVVAEELKIKNMTKSAKGSLLNPGKNVKAKSGLNRSILSEGWGKFFKMLEYKQKKRGHIFLQINPKNTSRTCPKCGHVSKDNRSTQAHFCCTNCGYTANADENAAGNILRAGLARIAQEVNSKRSQHCEPSEAEQ